MSDSPERPETFLGELVDRARKANGASPPQEGTGYSEETFWQALQDRAGEAAEENGTSPPEEVTEHVYNRLLARVFAAGPDTWMVDGGRSLAIRYPGFRLTTDLDVSTVAKGRLDLVVAAFIRAAERDAGDFVRFEVEAATQFSTPPGAQIDFAVTCGGRRVDGVSVDVVLSTPLAAEPDVRPLPRPLVSVGTEAADPGVRVRPLLNQMANKIGGLFIHWDGLPPSRAKDLVDILLMAAKEDFPGRRLHEVTREEFALIRARGNELHVPPRFEVPDESWERRYAKAVSRAPGCPQRTLDAAMPVARAFLDPLLLPDPPDADWDHERGRWVRPTEGERRSEVPTVERTSGTGMVAMDTPAQRGPVRRTAPASDEAHGNPLLRSPRRSPGQEGRPRPSLG
ncbi:nucleotidyl transferase AbiEii/AbiGii toxin family protein [Nocardiopsis sediminis]|uniref:Nucleotidyl transferase AbiEii/AbiGii toxin family protein n=1 Tax=Nocardiopsis sediminis TaxID=1778267 RepID=A0ABV8FSY8_9ACTN